MGEGYSFQLGRPFLGRFMKMGQGRTRVGWGVQKWPKKWDVLYGRSLTRWIFFGRPETQGVPCFATTLANGLF